MIDRLSRFARTDVRYLVESGFWLYAGQAISLVVALVSALAFANLLDPELYGNYKYILSVTSLLSIFTVSGLASALPRAAARGFDESLKAAFALTLRYSPAIMFIAGGLGVYYILNGNSTLGTSILIAGAATPIIGAASLFRPYLIGKKEFRLAGILSAIQTTIPPIATIAVVIFSKNVVALVATYFVSSALVTLALYHLTKSSHSGNGVDPELAHIGFNVSMINAINTVASKIDDILIFQLLGGSQLATYTFATAIPEQIRGSLKHITSLAVPKFALKDKETLKRVVKRNSYIIFAFSFLIMVTYVLLSPTIFAYLFPTYNSAVPYSQVYSLTLLTSLVLASSYFDAQAAVKEKYFLSFVSAFAITTTTVIGVIYAGIWGAIVGRVIARVIIVSATALTIKYH